MQGQLNHLKGLEGRGLQLLLLKEDGHPQIGVVSCPSGGRLSSSILAATNNRYLLLTVLEAECVRLRHLVSGETSFLVHRWPSPRSASMWQKGQRSSPFYKITNSIHGAPPSQPHQPQRPHLLISSY